MFADSPRRILNLILFLVNLAVLTSTGKGFFESMLIKKESAIQLFTSSFILLSWIFTGIRLLIALIVYIPLLSIIQGNLKEYCCHKIDKR